MEFKYKFASEADKEAFARQYGWEEVVRNPDQTMEENPVTVDDVIKEKTEEFFNGNIFAGRKIDYDIEKKEEVEDLKPIVEVEKTKITEVIK